MKTELYLPVENIGVQRHAIQMQGVRLDFRVDAGEALSGKAPDLRNALPLS